MNFKDEENRSSMAAEELHSGRQKAEESHNHRRGQDAEAAHRQRSSHAKQLENRPANMHPFDSVDGE